MLQFTAQQIAIMIQGQVEGDAAVAVNNFGKIEEAKKEIFPFSESKIRGIFIHNTSIYCYY